jgi:hypothetical protein
VNGIGDLRRIGALAAVLLAGCAKSAPPEATPSPGIATYPPRPATVATVVRMTAAEAPAAVKTPAQVAIGVVPPSRPSVKPTVTKGVHPPVIYAVRLSKTDIGEGDYVTGEVITSNNVTSVHAIIIGQSVPLPRKRSGHFYLFFTTPAFPFFLKGNQSVDFEAKTADGTSVKHTVTFHVH